MALPAGRYGVTKNQLLKIKKLPMNTIKLIEELTEKFDLLGTAAFKNSTSVVTQSTDLVESGAVKDIIGWGNKNLLENTTTSRTLNGLTFTVNNDKSVTVNGTASALTSIITGYIYNKDVGNEIDLFLNGCPAGGASNTYSLWVGIRNADDSGWVKSGRDVGDGFLLDIKDISYSYVRVEIEIASGQTINNLTFYPMISINGGAYEPYHPSVEQTLRDAEVIEGKNLFDGKATSVTDRDGLTWIVDPDDNNIVAVSGTPTGGALFKQDFDNVLPAGIYKLYGISDTTNIAFNAIVLYQGSTVVRIITGITEGGEFKILSSDVYNRIVLEYKRDTNNIPCSGTIRTMITKATVTDSVYEPYYIPLKDVVPTKADNSVIGTVEGSNASKAWSVGEHFIKDGAFKEVTQPIASGGAINDSNTVDKPIADCLVYKAGDSIEVGDGTYPTMYNGIFFSNNTALRFVIRVDKKIIANNVAISNSGIGICNADGIVASVLNLTANYNIIILNIKNTDIQVQMSKKDGTAFSVTDGSTAVVRFYGTLTFS